ncbi:KRAB-A domain-containing protein 2 [Portunus trituberculatus]|uniref:KRAB-A domain-containing protein 2 n=1 Tax=Portunus trituberculatus TaxID=210409 RepID=A0A5B7H281_PORTR|nr:KRAB-A domain-containing protein 2 [Portunus trituberculatus]
MQSFSHQSHAIFPTVNIMANPTECDLEAHFREELFKSEGKKSVLLPKEQYDKIIADLTAIDKTDKKTPHETYLLKKYEVLKGGDVFELIRRRNANEDPIDFATLEDTFDIVKRAHIATGHGGFDKMVKELTKKYANITYDTKYVSIYKHCASNANVNLSDQQLKGLLFDLF